MIYSYSCVIVWRGQLPYQKSLHTKFQDFGSIFGCAVFWRLTVSYVTYSFFSMSLPAILITKKIVFQQEFGQETVIFMSILAHGTVLECWYEGYGNAISVSIIPTSRPTIERTIENHYRHGSISDTIGLTLYVSPVYILSPSEIQTSYKYGLPPTSQSAPLFPRTSHTQTPSLHNPQWDPM